MGIIDDVKSVTKVIQQIENVELYRKILDLHAEIRNLVDENQDLKSEILSLKEALKTKESLQFECNAYWTKSNAGTRGDDHFAQSVGIKKVE
jgi:regulator of replication initiation timing